MSSGKQLSLFTFVDAFGWRIFQDHPFLEDRLQTAAPLNSILGYSCACDPTIITGELPSVHGHFSFFCYDPPKSPFATCRWLSMLPQTITKRGRVRRQLSKLIQRAHGFNGYFQIYNVPFNRLPFFDYSEKRDIYEAGGLVNGTPTIFDYLREHDIPFALSDWRRNEKQNISQMTEQIRQGDIRFGYLYLAELDGVLHAEGTKSPRVGQKIDWYDQQFRRLLDEADKRYDEVRLYVFSDHGMTNVTQNVNLVAEIDSLGLNFGVDYAVMYDSTMARIWTMSESAERRIRERLVQLDYGRILTEGELRNFGAFFEDGRYGDLIFLLNPGGLITPSYMNESHVPGMHGYDPAHEDSVALFASTAVVGNPPQRLDELYDLMREQADICGRVGVKTRHSSSECHADQLALAGVEG